MKRNKILHSNFSYRLYKNSQDEMASSFPERV